jgi:hypothetical protein
LESRGRRCDWDKKKQHFEVIVGKSILAFKREEEEDSPSGKCFGFVQTLDTKPKRRLFEPLKYQGHQLNQQIMFLSDGGDTVRDLQLYLSPEAEHLLDWFHLTMRLTVLQQTAKGLPETTSDGEKTYTLREDVVRELERLKWFLWHGNVYKALQVVQSVEMDLDAAVANSSDATARKLSKAVEEFHTYITNNKGFIPNYGERYRAGERISTGFVESTVNQVVSRRFCKRQQMQWSKLGAHRGLTPRVLMLSFLQALQLFYDLFGLSHHVSHNLGCGFDVVHQATRLAGIEHRVVDIPDEATQPTCR